MQKIGFSLIELMAAALITSIVVIAAYTLISNSTESFKNENERRLLESNLRNAELILQRDLSRIGYHVPMDDSGTLKVRAVRTWTRSIGSNHYSEFSLIADLVDFEEGFYVETSSDVGNRIIVTIQQHLMLPYSASEIATLSATGDSPARQPSGAHIFTQVFKRGFDNAIAVYVSSPNGTGAILPISTLDLDNYRIELEKNTFPADFEYNPLYGFKDLSVFPIVAITYRVSEEGDHTSLQRCYNQSLTNPSAGNIVESTCQTLIDNLEYFELFPIGNDLNYITGSPNGKVFGTHRTAAILSNEPQTITLGNLRRFYYMMGAAGRRLSTVFSTESATQPRFNDRKQPLEHIQGIALFKTPNRSVSSTTVFDSSYNR